MVRHRDSRTEFNRSDSVERGSLPSDRADQPFDQNTFMSPPAPIIDSRIASSARLPSTRARVNGASGEHLNSISSGQQDSEASQWHPLIKGDRVSHLNFAGAYRPPSSVRNSFAPWQIPLCKKLGMPVQVDQHIDMTKFFYFLLFFPPSPASPSPPVF
jgi:hypothetical protein